MTKFDKTTAPGDSDSSQPDRVLQSPHDRLINQTLQQVDAARILLARHLPSDVVKHLKLQTLTHVDTSLIDSNLRRRFVDRLFSVEVSEELVRSLSLPIHYVYVFVLIDHKSTDEPQTLIQILGYIIRIWETALENRQPLVPIIPWVIYNGVSPWRAARSLDQLIPVPESWKRYVPGLELTILDVSRMADTAMVGHPVLQVTLTLLKYARDPQLTVYLRPVLQSVADAISVQQAHSLLATMRIFVMSVNPKVGADPLDSLVEEFWPVEPEPGSVADQLIRQGEAIGEARGEAKEKREMIRMLQSMLGVSPTSHADLSGKSLVELQAMIDGLREQLVNRLH